MSKAVISRPMFEVLVKHLVDIEEEKELIIDKFYSDSPEDRSIFESFINEYIKKVEGYISNVKITKDAPDICPFVIIGSIVEVEDVQCKDIEKFQIVSPFYNKVNSRQECASFMSPIGHALLLKKVMDVVDVKTPISSFTYKINSIELPHDDFKCLTNK